MTDHMIIGSEALNFHYPNLGREPKDIDIIALERYFENIVDMEKDRIEYIQHSPTGLSHIIKYEDDLRPREFFIADKQESLMKILDYRHTSHYASLGVLYSLKKAHIHYPIKFSKHIQDYILLRSLIRKQEGVYSVDDLADLERDRLDLNPELTRLLQQDTVKRLGELKTPKMNQNTEKFFGKSKKYVKSYYVHDDMHKAIAMMHSGQVQYEKILKDNSEVETDYEKWKTLPVREQIYCVLEEVYVIALERKILPGIFETDTPQWNAKDAFDWALMRVCTTLCDGFFREFATRAYKQIQGRYNAGYVESFLKTISQYDRIEAD